MRLFNGTIEKEILEDVLSFIGSYVSEVRVRVNDEGATFCFINPENTVASYITIPWNCWDYFMVEEELEVGIDVRRILEILPILGGLVEAIIEKDYKLDNRTFKLAFLLKSGNITYIVAAIDPEWMRKCMPRETFENIKDTAKDGTKIVLEHKLFKDLVKTAKQDLLYLESHDEEIIVYNGYRELVPLEFEGIIYNPSKALYKIEYLKPLANLKTPIELEIYFATEKPCYITTELKCATLEMVVAPYVPTEEKDWEAYAPKRIEYDHVITIDIPKDLVRAIKHIKPNAVYINEDNNEIYFVNYIPRVRWNSYVVLKDIRGLGGMRGFYDCISNLAEFVLEKITIGIVGDKLYINDQEVGVKRAEDFEIYKPTSYYNQITIPLKDFKNLIRACGGETGRFAIVADGECLRLAAVIPEDEVVFSHCLFSPYREKRVVRAPYIETLPSGIGDIVNIYYQEGLGSPILFEYVRRKRKEEIPLFYYNATPHPEAEKEHIEELEEIIFGVKVEEEKPPEKPPGEKRELPYDIQDKLSEAKGFVRQTRSYLQDLSQIYEKELVKVFNRLYDTFREVETLVGTAPSKEALKMLNELQNEFLELGKRISLIRTKIADYDKERLGLEIRLKPFEWHDDAKEVLTELSNIAHELRKWDSRLEDLAERIKGYVKKIQELKEKPPYFIDSWVVRYVPSDKVFQFSYIVNGLRGAPLYFNTLEELNEFLEKGKGEVYIPQKRETGIVEWKPARIPRLFKFKAGEVVDTPTATYTLEQPLVKSDNPDVWIWQVAVWDKVKHEDRREYLTEDEIEKLKSTFEEKPERREKIEPAKKPKNVFWEGANSIVTLEKDYSKWVKFGVPGRYCWYLKRPEAYKLLFSWKHDYYDKRREYGDFKSEYERWKENEIVWNLIKEDIRKFEEKYYKKFISPLKRPEGEETEKLVDEASKRTPTLEDILAELEPLGYRERWRVVESLKAKGFEDVEETIDKFIREGELRKVGKYIEATREVWREYQKMLAEKVEKGEEEPVEEEEEIKTVTPEEELPKEEQEKLQTMFNILTKNGWSFSKFDKKWFFKFKKYGIKTYKDRYIFSKLFKKYSGQFERILSKMSEEDKQKLAETGFFELYDRFKRGERLFTDVRVKREKEEEPWMKDEPFDKEFVQLYNEFSHFWVDPNKEFKKEIKAIEDKIIMEFGKIPKSIEPALRNYRKALYEFFKEEARARAIAPPVTVVGPQKYEGKPEQAQKIREKALEKLEKARKWLEEAISREKHKRMTKKVEEEVQLTIDELKGNRLKKDLGLDVASKIWDYKHKDGSGDFGFMLKKGVKWVKLTGSYTPSGKVYGLMIETSEHAPQAIPVEIRTYEDLINYLREVFEVKKPEVKEEKEEKPPVEEKPPAKPPAEPYDFILEKLKSTFLAELELAGLSKEEAERELEAIMFEIERLARDVVEGKLAQVEAVKEVIKKARTITRPTEVAPPEELKVVKEEGPSRVRRVKEIWEERRAEYAPPPETTEMAMRIKDVMESLGWKGVVELLKPHLPEIFAYGIEDFLKRHREWSLAVPPTKGNVEAIFRNLRRSIEQQALEKYNRGELSFREWLIGGAPDRIRLPLLAMLLYYGYTSNAFKKELRKVYETPEIQDALKKYGVTSFDEFYDAMVEFLRQYRL